MFGLKLSGAVLIGLGIVVVLCLAAGGKMLKKAGENPWKILIPVYGGYCLYRIASSEGIFWGTLIVTAVSNTISRIVASNIAKNTSYWETPNTTPLTVIAIISGIILMIMQVYYVRNLADAFGKGTGFAAGLFFLFPVFVMILGFGNATYGGRSGLASVQSSTGQWKCPACGTENPQFKATCQNCGAQK